jgi:hypothetical protein
MVNLKVGKYYWIKANAIEETLHKRKVIAKLLGFKSYDSNLGLWELICQISYSGFRHSCGGLGKSGYCYYGQVGDVILKECSEKEALAWLI